MTRSSVIGRLAGPSVVALVAIAAACGRRSGSPTGGGGESGVMPRPAPQTSTVTASAPSVSGVAGEGSACDHLACGKDYVVDAVQLGPCRVGVACKVAFVLVAKGPYHVNDEYPYKFRADDAPDVEFLGTDPAGKNVFTKAAGDWSKTGPRSGALAVAFRPSAGAGVSAPAERSVAGVFKLSVCSPESCRLEEARLTAKVAVAER
ncbi:MAG TPA: hypothetical protein VE987_12335 [Polyangiaceae bacterium]|nr:hypothetical protein [Polyangiaceae bacterium]